MAESEHSTKGTRADVLAAVRDHILAIEASHPRRVAIDGVDGAGKTRLADELAALIASSGREVVRASIDSFHHPRVIRYERGRLSHEGFYYDTYDLETLERCVLTPLSPSGSREVRTAAFDWRTDAAVEATPVVVGPEAILLFDGIFLHRPELREAWDLSIFLDVTFETSLARNITRHEQETETPDVPEVMEHFRKRYNGPRRSIVFWVRRYLYRLHDLRNLKFFLKDILREQFRRLVFK